MSNFAVGIIIVSGKGELIDTVVGLEIGADDYITKPFELRDVIARIRAVLRRSKAPESKPDPERPTTESEANTGFTFDQWSLDTAVRELRDNQDQICELTTGEYDLLHLLVRRARQVLSRDEIMDQIKGDNWAANDRTIDNQIARLNKSYPTTIPVAQLLKQFVVLAICLLPVLNPWIDAVPNNLAS